jgi:1-deoxy-D-xylulose-5-phosphate synthase
VLPIGKGRVVREGTDVAILSIGTRLQAALEAAAELEGLGISATVADARFVKPLDADLIRRLAQNHRMLVTVEEGAIGGFGSHVLHMLADENLFGSGLVLKTMILPDVFQDHDDPHRQYDTARLNAPDIVRVVEAAMAQSA